MKIEDIYWHDAVIHNIIVDRNNPGINDSLKFEIEWIDGKSSILIFNEVYWANLMLNFGVVAEETILDVCLGNEDDVDYIRFKSIWEKYVDIRSFNIYIMNLNSTGGQVKIIAKSFSINGCL
jgi:hypothetical protein